MSKTTNKMCQSCWKKLAYIRLGNQWYCPTCTIYTHPIKACRDAMLLEYKAQHKELIKHLEKKVKAQSEQRSTSN